MTLSTEFTRKANILIDQSCRARLADFELLTTVSDLTTLNSSAQGRGGTARWMSPEFVDAEIQGYRRTKPSDRYALGMVIYEVLSGRVPFYQHADWTIPGMVVKGDRPERPQGPGEVWFTGAIWNMLKRCWVAQPKNRSSIEVVLRCLEKASRTLTLRSRPQVTVPSTTDSPTTKNVIAVSLSALAAARMIEDLGHISYPEGVSGPKPELNVNSKEGKFR